MNIKQDESVCECNQLGQFQNAQIFDITDTVCTPVALLSAIGFAQFCVHIAESDEHARIARPVQTYVVCVDD
jgi:hypothetical protein